MGRIPSIRHTKQCLQYLRRDAFDVLHHLGVGEPEDGETQLAQSSIAALVRPHIIMRPAVHLDDQRLRGTQEVGDERADHGLPAELEPAELRSRQGAIPQPLFGFGRFAAHFSREAMQLGEALGIDAPPPAPPLKGRGVKADRLISRR